MGLDTRQNSTQERKSKSPAWGDTQRCEPKTPGTEMQNRQGVNTPLQSNVESMSEI